MYNGKISYQGAEITVDQAVTLGRIVRDGNGDIWLKQDTNKAVKIVGDLFLQ
jgi:hypothetical protein